MPTGKITALRAQVHDPQRVNLFLDDVFALGISLNTIVKENLFVGKELGEDEFARLAASESVDKAYQAGLRFLNARPRSAAEIRERLRRKEFSDEAIVGALDRLERIGLVDDAAFARFWVENRLIVNPRGTSALRHELQRKGIDRDVADGVLDDDALVGDQDDRALQLARVALRKYADAPDKMTFTRKLGGYLQRRGFSFTTIRPVIDSLWAELRVQRASDSDRDDA